MKDNPLISIVIPVYKVEKYIHECVNSVISQTYKNLDIILVDDGSPDNCPKICDDYQKQDSRIRVIHKANGGLSSARNAGIKIAKGEYIAFIDSDDYVSRTYVEQMYTTLSLSGADIACVAYSSENTNMKHSIVMEYEVYTAESALKKLLLSSWGACAKLFRFRIFESADMMFPEGLIYEDIAVMFKICGSVAKIAFSNSVNYYYRHNPNSTTLSSSLFPEKYKHFYKACSIAEDYLRENYPNLLKYLHNMYIRFTMTFILRASLLQDQYPQVIPDLVSRIHVSDIPRYMFSNSRLINKIAMVVVAFAPKLGVKIISMISKTSPAK